MTKRLIDVDDEALEEAKRLLGSRSYKDTVNAGLREIIARAAREREIDRFLSAEADDLGAADVTASAWR